MQKIPAPYAKTGITHTFFFPPQMLATIEKEMSLKSDHELQHEQDVIRAEVIKAGESEEVDLEEAVRQTAVEFEDACLEELKAFKASITDPGEHCQCVECDFSLFFSFYE